MFSKSPLLGMPLASCSDRAARRRLGAAVMLDGLKGFCRCRGEDKDEWRMGEELGWYQWKDVISHGKDEIQLSLTEYERGISQVLWVLNLFPEFINCPH